MQLRRSPASPYRASVRSAVSLCASIFLSLAGACSGDSPTANDGGGDGGGGGGGGGGGPTAAVATITLTPGSSLLDVGKTVTLTAQVVDSAGTVLSRTVTWASSDSAVATVSNGVVTARQGGTVVISARSGTVVGVALLAIADAAVGSVAVSPATGTLVVGATAQLTATILDTLGRPLTGRRIAWQSSHPDIASVSASGVVTAHLPGTAVIRASSQNVVGSAAVDVRPQNPLADGSGRIALSTDHACGLALDGITYCWGAWYGKAQGTATSPDAYMHTWTDSIHGGHRFVQITGAGNVTAGLKADGTVWIWGIDNGTKLLGGAMAYTPQPVLTDVRFTKLFQGNYNLFGLTADGRMYGWGSNHFGELGSGNTGDQQFPVAVVSDLRFRSVSNEDDHGSLFLTTTGEVYAVGRFGNADFVHWPSPHSFASLAGFSLYGDHVVGITSDGIAYEVASNGTARRVGGSYTYREIVLGVTSYGLTTDGRVVTWTYDTNTGTNSEPSVLLASRRFLDLEEEYDGVLALEDNGDVIGIGSNRAWRLAPVAPNTGSLAEPTGPHAPAYRIVALTDGVSIEAGGTATYRIRLKEVTGGFTIHGPRRLTTPVPVVVQNPIAGVQVTVFPEVLHGDGAEAAVTVKASATASPGSSNIHLAGTALPELMLPGASTPLTILPPPPPPGETPTLNLVCTSTSTPLPAGFHCLQNSGGNLVPGKFAGDAKFNALMHGTWVDVSAGVCVTWGANGTATARYSGAGIGGGGPTQTGSGRWGVVVRKSGVPEGTTTQWYVFTSILDAQTQLLGFDSAAPDGAQVMGWQFNKRACPW